MRIKTIIILVCILLSTVAAISVNSEFLSNARDNKCRQSPRPDRVSGIFEAYDGSMSDQKVKERLDALGDYLKGAPSFRVYIVSYAGIRSCRGEALARAHTAKDYLSRVKMISRQRIRTIDGGFQEEWTVQLWTTADGASPPTPIPTVDRAKVKIISNCKRAGSRPL